MAWGRVAGSVVVILSSDDEAQDSGGARVGGVSTPSAPPAGGTREVVNLVSEDEDEGADAGARPEAGWGASAPSLARSSASASHVLPGAAAPSVIMLGGTPLNGLPISTLAEHLTAASGGVIQFKTGPVAKKKQPDAVIVCGPEQERADIESGATPKPAYLKNWADSEGIKRLYGEKDIGRICKKFCTSEVVAKLVEVMAARKRKSSGAGAGAGEGGGAAGSSRRRSGNSGAGAAAAAAPAAHLDLFNLLRAAGRVSLCEKLCDNSDLRSRVQAYATRVYTATSHGRVPEMVPATSAKGHTYTKPVFLEEYTPPVMAALRNLNIERLH